VLLPKIGHSGFVSFVAHLICRVFQAILDDTRNTNPNDDDDLIPFAFNSYASLVSEALLKPPSVLRRKRVLLPLQARAPPVDATHVSSEMPRKTTTIGPQNVRMSTR
jgi:hypothetical protein